jgi:hypothetical protein
MSFGQQQEAELDDTDLRILDMLQDDCRTALARIGEHVGLSAPSVLERIKKLEAAGVITGYRAALDARRLGLDVTAFIGVITSQPDKIGGLEPADRADGASSSATTSPGIHAAAQGRRRARRRSGLITETVARRRHPHRDHRRAVHARRGHRLTLHPEELPPPAHGKRTRRAGERNGHLRRA